MLEVVVDVPGTRGVDAEDEDRAPATLTPEVRDQLLYYASRAPSPHNAQGWVIDPHGSTFRISRHPEHQVLRDFDPEGHESDLACGAVVTNLCVAARAFGYHTDVRWRPGPWTVAEVTLTPAPDAPDAAAKERLDALRRRAMNRSAYRPDLVPGPVLDDLRANAARLGFTLSVVTDRAAVERMAKVAARAGVLKLTHGATQEELHGLTRFKASDAARRRDGLDLELFFAPAAAARAGAALTHPRVLSAAKPLRLAEALIRDNDEMPLRSAPALCLLYADALDGQTFPRGGACLEELALDIADAHLAMALHSAPIEVGLSYPLPPAGSVPAGWHGAIAEVRRDLLEVFDAPDGAVPIALFRLGTPTRQPERRSLRRSVPRQAPATDHYREMTRRNHPSLDLHEQDALRGTRVLVAGCGSIGGAVVEPLVRLGVERFVLCEPGDYELNNLNRQAADIDDIGRNKATVLADRARAINPGAELLVETAGVTDDNVDWLVGTTDLVIDGVDVTEPQGIAAKRALHEEAWRQRRLVISGLDLGGTQLVYAFDYRDGRVRPFDGRIDGAAGELTPLEFLAQLVSPMDVPRELLSYSIAMVRGEAGSPPQLAPTADQFGVLAAWMVLDFALGRPLRKRVKVAIPNLVAPRRQLLVREVGRIAEAVRLKKMLMQAARRRSENARGERA